MTDTKTEKKNIPHYQRYRETVKKCVSIYQKKNRPKLNEYMRNYYTDPEKREKQRECMRRYRAKKKREKELEKERKRIVDKFINNKI
jgi:hypothetical protein